MSEMAGLLESEIDALYSQLTDAREESGMWQARAGELEAEVERLRDILGDLAGNIEAALR